MKIRIATPEHTFRLRFPTALIFGKLPLRLAFGTAEIFVPEVMEEIPAEAARLLGAEIMRIKKKYGSWDLMEIESADGYHIKITL